MAKGKTSVYFCQSCGYESSKWMGQCPGCKEWNTFVEEVIDKKQTEKVRKQAHATPNIIANSTASPDTYKVPVTAGRRPYCGAALTGRHSDDGRNILIPTSLNAGILSIKICISIIPISAATTKAIIYIKTLQNVFAIFLYITKSFLAYFGKKKDVSIRHTLFHIFLFHWNESHIFYSLLSCLSKDNIQECLLNICRIP